MLYSSHRNSVQLSCSMTTMTLYGSNGISGYVIMIKKLQIRKLCDLFAVYQKMPKDHRRHQFMPTMHRKTVRTSIQK